MKNYDQSVEINHNPNWPYMPNHLMKTSFGEKIKAINNKIEQISIAEKQYQELNKR